MILGREVDNLTKSLETGTSDFFQKSDYFEKKIEVPGISGANKKII